MSQTFIDAIFIEPKPLSVSQLTAQIKQHLELRFSSVWIEGEISNFVRHGSGHWYFTIKDAEAQIDACCFKLANRYIRFRPENGLAIRARGRISLYEPRGRYQIVVESLEPVGVGALQLAFEQLKADLAAEGLFDADRKRPLPLLPRKIGIVTSPTGAAIRDMLKVLQRRNRGVDILLAPTRVQGDGAAEEIVRAIRLLNERADIDVIIVGRGGGSLEDLWCFNEAIVARAIFNSRIPIISAVGHEVDFTIADFVADLRAPTPSAAAEQVAGAREELAARLRGAAIDLVRAIQFKLMENRAHVTGLENSRGFTLTRDRVYQLSQRLDDAENRLNSQFALNLAGRRQRWLKAALKLNTATLSGRHAQASNQLCLVIGRMESAVRARLEADSRRLGLAGGKLSALSPLSVLGRGYAMVFDERGKVVRHAVDVRNGQRLHLRLAEGEIDVVREIIPVQNRLFDE